MRFCPSRNTGRHCTKPLGHAGLHRHVGAMWTDATADSARCPGSGEPGAPVAVLPNGFPHGRALCERCLRFVALDAAGNLAEHDTTDAAETDTELVDRRDWFNTHGW